MCIEIFILINFVITNFYILVVNIYNFILINIIHKYIKLKILFFFIHF